MQASSVGSTLILAGVILVSLIGPVFAQVSDSNPPRNTHSADDLSIAAADTATLQQALTRLRDQMKALEQNIQKHAPPLPQQPVAMVGSMQNSRSNSQSANPDPQPAADGMKLTPMEPMDDRGMESRMKAPSSAPMPPSQSVGVEMDTGMSRSKMRDDDTMMSMSAMGGENSSPAQAPMPSALPGFPGQSRLYHIGATGFFVDHSQHITLTTPQQRMLEQHKQQALELQADLQRQISAAEERLWELTGADQPQISAINQQVRAIERMRADQRIAFIRAVGEAAEILTSEQRRQLTGTASTQPADMPSMSAPGTNQPQTGDMGHM